MWPALGDAFHDAPFDAIVDAGRLGHRGLPSGLASAASVVGLVCRTSLVSLAGVRVHLSALLDAAPPGRCGLVLVGPGRPYLAAEVSEQFGVPVLAEIAWDPATATDVAHGEVPRKWHRTPLARSFAHAARQLASRVSTPTREVVPA